MDKDGRLDKVGQSARAQKENIEKESERASEQCLAGPHGQGRPVLRHGRAGYRRSGAWYGQGQYWGSV